MKNSFTSGLIIIALLAGCFLLTHMLYKSSRYNKSLSNDISQLQSSLSLKPKIVKIDSVVYKDRYYNIYKSPKLNVDNTAGKLLAAGDSKKLDSLNKALGIKTKDLLSYKDVNMKLTIQNKKLTQSLQNPSKIEYRDKYVTLVVDRENNIIDTLSHKLNLQSSNYMKSPKWYKGKEEYYVVSVDDPRVKLELTGFDTKPKNTTSSIYVDNRYQLNPSTLSNGQLSSTLNYEFGMDNIISLYVGGGYQTDFINKAQPVVNVGAKINLHRNKK